MRCPACGFENPDGARFCGSCGAVLGQACPSCGADNPPGFRFCASCGASLEAAAEPDAAPPALAGERRRVTVLFADLVGFSTLAEHLDPEELRTLMTDTFAELTEEVERREGVVEKFIGDAVVAVFGAPVSHEDDPARAVEAARAMLDIVDRRSASAPSRLELRIGINSGLVVSGAVGDGSQTGVMGDTVNVAARLQQTASPGEVLVAASTWRRVRDAYEAEPVGALEVKGKAQPVEAYRVGGPREGEARPQSPFVGRRDELALIELLWSSTCKGNTHVVSIIGEPGVGKSRLLEELPVRPDALDLRIMCGGERAFGPFLDLVESVLGGLPADIEELEGKADTFGLELEDALLLGAFLGLAGAPPVVRMADEQRMRQVFSGVWRLLLATCRERPALIALDDSHWLDESSRALLAFLLEQLGGISILLVLLHRPGARPFQNVELRASHTTLGLEPLTPEDSIALARGLLGVPELPEDLEQLVATRAEGNPFFIEELLQALLELGSLAIVEGNAVLAQVEVDVPDTVQGTILARVDRLSARERAVLQRAAVLGRSFSVDLLERVAGDGDLSLTLAELARAQILVQRGPGEWAFKHSLIQEVTYDTLLLRQRRELHREIAEAIEPEAAEDPGLLEALAEHFARAEAPEEARRYAVAAGDLARQRAGYVDATRRYETALRLWGEGNDEGRLELLEKLGQTALTAGDVGLARTALLEAEDGWRRLGQMRRAGHSLALLGRVYWLAGESERAAGVLDEAITLLGDERSAELAEAYFSASTLQMLLGRSGESAPLARTGLELAEELGLVRLQSHLMNTLGACEMANGDLSGIARIEAALELAKESGDVEALGRAYTNLSHTYWAAGRLTDAIAIAEEGRTAMHHAGAPSLALFIAANAAGSLLDLGRLEEVENLTSRILSEERAVLGAPGFVNLAISRIPALARVGRLSDARSLLDEVLPVARGVGGGQFLTALLSVDAELELGRGNIAPARQACREAVAIGDLEQDFSYWYQVLPLAARLLEAEAATVLVEQAEARAVFPALSAARMEARAILDHRPELFSEAADLYHNLPLPYQETRCLIEAGELGRARGLVDRYGLGAGPLGRALELAEQTA